ncbi:MAG: hypothetical protein KBB88_01930 [Candidatus Pacebacteria bacterium]|nr:hypothetical protein [Candidatus Paceibacterota bacterium]
MNEKQLFEKLTSVHLTQEEKRFMQQDVLLRSRRRGILSPFTSFFYFSRSFVRVTALATFLLLCTTLVHASERSIPGDSLYGVKRNVNERVLGVFAVSDTKKAQLETKFVDRRLVEIQKVVENAQDEVVRATETGSTKTVTSVTNNTQEYIASLTDEVMVHANNAKNLITSVSEKGESENALVLASDLASTIDIHTSALTSSVLNNEMPKTLSVTAPLNTKDVSLDNSEKAKEISPTVVVSSKTDVSTEDVHPENETGSMNSIGILTSTISSSVSSTLATLSNSSNDVADLGVSIEVAVTNSVSLVDGTKAKQKLDEAKKQLALYKNEIKFSESKTVVVSEIASDKIVKAQIDSGDEATTVSSTVSLETKENKLIGNTLSVQTPDPLVVVLPMNPEVIETELISNIPTEPVVSPEPITTVEQVPLSLPTKEPNEFKNDVSQVYVLPTIEQIEVTIGTCEMKINEEKYSDAFISCTKALRHINTLREVLKQRQKETQNLVQQSLTVEDVTQAPEAVSLESSAVGVNAELPSSNSKNGSLTGTVLNAINTQRTTSTTPLPTKKDL